MNLRDFFVSGTLRRLAPHLQKRLELANAYQRAFDTPDGQVVLRDMIREAGILEVAQDPSDSRFYDGKRAVGLHVLNRLRWSAGELTRLGEELTYEQVVQLDREAA